MDKFCDVYEQGTLLVKRAKIHQFIPGYEGRPAAVIERPDGWLMTVSVNSCKMIATPTTDAPQAKGSEVGK